MAVMKHFNYFYLFVRVLMEGAGEDENTVSFAMSFPYTWNTLTSA